MTPVRHCPDGSPGRVAIQETVTFEGGTGRIASASGTATITGEADPVNARSSFTTTGTIPRSRVGCDGHTIANRLERETARAI
jgi:hypothetical protein